MNCFWKVIEWIFRPSYKQLKKNDPPPTKKEPLQNSFPIMIHQREFYNILKEYIQPMIEQGDNVQIKRVNSFTNLLAAWPVYEWEEAVKVENLQNCIARAMGRFYFLNLTGLFARECYFALDSATKQIICFENKDCTNQVVIDKDISRIAKIELIEKPSFYVSN